MRERVELLRGTTRGRLLTGPAHALGLEGWELALEPLGRDRTRLIARGGVPDGPACGILMEIPHFLMERRMLLGIKQRAEANPG